MLSSMLRYFQNGIACVQRNARGRLECRCEVILVLHLANTPLKVRYAL